MKANHATLILIGLAVVVGVVGVAAAVTAFSNRSAADSVRSREAATPVAGSTTPIEPAPATQGERIVVERVTIFPYGFEPNEINRPAGPFLLAIDNRAGTDDFSLELVSERNERIHSDSIRRGRARTRRLLTLGPGRYLLRENNHPQWTCTITITPRSGN